MSGYLQVRAGVWTSMREARYRHGLPNYSLFVWRARGSSFGDISRAITGMASDEVNATWQRDVTHFFRLPLGAPRTRRSHPPRILPPP